METLQNKPDARESGNFEQFGAGIENQEAAGLNLEKKVQEPVYPGSNIELQQKKSERTDSNLEITQQQKQNLQVLANTGALPPDLDHQLLENTAADQLMQTVYKDVRPDSEPIAEN